MPISSRPPTRTHTDRNPRARYATSFTLVADLDEGHPDALLTLGVRS